MKPALPLHVLVIFAASIAHAGEADVGQRDIGQVRSVKALRDFGVVKQGYDYSCGAAALATLLTHGTGHPTDEESVLKAVFETATPEQQEQLVQKGLSLLDLQRVAEGRGLRAQGFRIGADQIQRLARPVIVFIRPWGYEHFAVLKGVRDGRVHLADPSLGNVRMPLYRFMEMWADRDGRGVVFAVEPKDGQWPEASLLQPPAGKGHPLEALSARQLMDVASPYNPSRPNPIVLR